MVIKMKANNIKKYLYKKRRGQALLVVMVVSSLTMLLLMGMAGRIINSRTNVRRSSEFGRSLSSSENAINDIVRLVDSSGAECLSGLTTEYTRRQNCGDVGNGIDIFARIPPDNSAFIGINPYRPIIIGHNSVDDTSLKPVGVRIECAAAGTGVAVPPDSNNKFEITRIFQSGTEYRVDKGMSDCSAANSALNTPSGNMTFYNSDGATVNWNNIYSVGDVLKAVVVRPLDSPTSPITSIRNYKVEIISCNNAGSSCRTTDTTSKIEFLIVGLGGLGSDNIIQFEIPAGTTSNTFLGYGFSYFGENK
jgi:hypothetical protein